MGHTTPYRKKAVLLNVNLFKKLKLWDININKLILWDGHYYEVSITSYMLVKDLVKLMSKWIFALIQFLPLSTFAVFAFWHGVPANDRWLQSFLFGALLGLIQLAILLPQKKTLNRLVLACNIYLILGGLAVFFQQWWYLKIYGSFRESAIIILIVIIGSITTLYSSSGFIAVKGSDRKFSVYLLLASVSMIPFAVIFQGNRIYAAVLPIIFLAILQRYLTHIAKQMVVVH